MRSVNSVWYRNFIYNLDLTKARYSEALARSSSGKQLNKLSDNPSDMAYTLSLRSNIAQVNQFSTNIKSGQAALSASETALNGALTLMYRTISLAEQGASESTSTDGRAIIADEINEIRKSMINYANTELNGRYLFSGTATSTLPYAETGGVVNYSGNSDPTSIQADFSVQVETSIPGDEVFSGAVDVFQRLADLRDALLADDTDAITASISTMSEMNDQINEALGMVGNRSTRLTQIAGTLNEFKAAMTEKMSSLEDANMAEVATDMATTSAAMSATIQAAASINNMSLIDYLS
jgi:flagellar hook-associated protein 3 FlgL